MPTGQCKRTSFRPGVYHFRTRHGLLLAGLAGLLIGLACGTRPRPRAVSVRALETAELVKPSGVQRAVVSDPAELDDLCYPLGRRVALLQVRSPEQWARLRRLAPELRGDPDLTRGIVVGLVSRTGLPVNGIWPVHLENARVHDGAGFVAACFHGGSFLPDGTTYIETAQIDGLATVLIVELNSTRFYPE